MWKDDPDDPDDTDNSDIYEDKPQMMECKEYPEVDADNYCCLNRKLKESFDKEQTFQIIILLITQGRI